MKTTDQLYDEFFESDKHQSPNTYERQAANEILIWKRTGKLPDMLVNRFAKMIQEEHKVDYALKLAESTICDRALQYLAKVN